MRKAFDFFIFTSLFISCCAVLMANQTNQLLQLDYNHNDYLAFVFFATLASYNFHWLLTPHSEPEKQRTAWTQKYRWLHILLLCSGLAGVCWWGIKFIQQWWQMGIAAGLTFLYSAPKIPYPLFSWLKKMAIGKTIFLAFVWTYVTAVLPVLLSTEKFSILAILFCISRFFLVYAVCIVFDYRDREADRKQGIRSMITYFTEKGIDRLFFFSICLFVAATLACGYYGMPLSLVTILLLPAVFLVYLFKKAKTDFSDYLYDFVIDGMMVLSSLFTPFIRI
jgi:4-hydroxybenzoate polyprenyltransferase